MAATPFTFTPTDFKDGSDGGTPITAAELNKINTGIAQLYNSLPVYTVKTTSDTPPSTPCLMTVIDANGAYQGTYYNDGTATTLIGQPPVKTYTGTAKPTSDYYGSVVVYGHGRSAQILCTLPTGLTISGFDDIPIFSLPAEAAPRELVRTTHPSSTPANGSMHVTVMTNGVVTMTYRSNTAHPADFLDFTYQLN